MTTRTEKPTTAPADVVRKQAALDLAAACDMDLETALRLVDRAAAANMTTTARELLGMTLEDAQARKWKEGRLKFGPDWQGELPILEAYSEVLDVLCYLDEHLRRDPGDDAARRLRLGIYLSALELVRLGRDALRKEAHDAPAVCEPTARPAGWGTTPPHRPQPPPPKDTRDGRPPTRWKRPCYDPDGY